MLYCACVVGLSTEVMPPESLQIEAATKLLGILSQVRQASSPCSCCLTSCDLDSLLDPRSLLVHALVRPTVGPAWPCSTC